MINKEILELLVCPVSKGELVYDSNTEELVCKESGLAYPVDAGIPVMLESRARTLSEAELAS